MDRRKEGTMKKAGRSAQRQGATGHARPGPLKRPADRHHVEPANEPLVPPTSSPAAVKEDFCTQILMDGYVHAFVDMFYLIHRQDAAASTDKEEASTLPSPVMDISEMEFLRDHLVAAELCKRKGEVMEVLSAYENLAVYCREKNDLKTMVFFLEKCVEVMRLAKDQPQELRMLGEVGNGYHRLGDLNKACACLEERVAMAEIVYEHEDDAPLRVEAYIHLGKIYQDQAQTCETKRLYEQAIAIYTKLMETSKKGEDASKSAWAQYKIGVCYNALHQPSSAIPYLEAYLEASVKEEDAEGEGDACAELATAYEKLENKELSIEFLNRCSAIATVTSDVAKQADAFGRLGHIYTSSQEFTKAREMQEKTYELMPALASRRGDRSAVNCTRIDVGAARANEKLSILLALVKDDVPSLLEWKSNRSLPTEETEV